MTHPTPEAKREEEGELGLWSPGSPSRPKPRAASERTVLSILGPSMWTEGGSKEGPRAVPLGSERALPLDLLQGRGSWKQKTCWAGGFIQGRGPLLWQAGCRQSASRGGVLAHACDQELLWLGCFLCAQGNLLS